MKKNNGFTLTELLIVIAILAMMGAILIGIINPVFLIGKAHDSRRKSDLNKIKIAFEEYYSDKGEYPSNINTWNTKNNCGKEIIDGNTDIGKYIKNWPCDPLGEVYRVEANAKNFRIILNLENRKDVDIPINWYVEGNPYVLEGFTKEDANYGVSSSNIHWYNRVLSATCNLAVCQIKTPSGGCDSVTHCSGPNCYYGPDCHDLGCQINVCP